MKITDIKCYPLEAPAADQLGWSQGWVSGRRALIIEVLTDEGISGWGEAFCAHQPPQLPMAVIEHVFKPMVIGKSPFDVGVLWEKMYNISMMYGQGGTVIIALSAIDIALWDIVGKALQKPVFQLMGGAYRDTLTAYATGFYRHHDLPYPQSAVDEAVQRVSEGFKGLKLKTGWGVEKDVEVIYKTREAVGPDIRVMCDANCAYDYAKSRKILYETEKADLYWFEEPMPNTNLEDYAALRSLTKTYIAAGESEFTKIHFRKWLEARALDIYQTDICVCGGFTETKKILGMCEAYCVQVCPHIWGSGIGLAAGLQLLAMIPPSPVTFYPDEPMVELDRSTHPFRQALIYGAIDLAENGTVKIPQGPGLGIEVDRSVLEHFRIK